MRFATTPNYNVMLEIINDQNIARINQSEIRRSRQRSQNARMECASKRSERRVIGRTRYATEPLPGRNAQ